MNAQIKHKFKRGEGEKLAAGQITWEQFVTCNNDARGVRYKFEDLSRQLFTYEFLSQNKKHKYVHSNPNNPGIESEPILDEENDRYIGYQAKFFDKDADYNQIKESAEKAVKPRKSVRYARIHRATLSFTQKITRIELRKVSEKKNL